MNMMPFLSPRGERHIYSKPDMEKYIKAISQWIDGIPYEKAFWNNVYRWKQTFNGMMQTMAESSIWNILTQTVSSRPVLPANLKFWMWDAD